MIRQILDRLLELIYPGRCIVCDGVLPYGSDRGCCKRCGPELAKVALVENICSKCGKHHPSTSGSLCFDCSRSVRKFNEGRGLWVYGDAVQDAIHRFKYSGKADLALSFAREAALYYKERTRWQIDTVVPVPLHPERLKDRGFDQCALLAKHLGEALGLPVRYDVLERQKATLPQHGLNDKQRQRNMEGAIKLDPVHSKKWPLGNVLVVDDIFTTGATMDACAEALFGAGAEAVYFLVLAIGEGY